MNRVGERFRTREALFWSVSWGLGAAIGVALGGWLTLVGGAGAPGAEGLEPISDLVVLPLAAFGVVMIVHLCVQVVAATYRGRAVARREAESDDKGGEHDGVTR